MTQALNVVEELQEYVRGARERADHHGRGVADVLGHLLFEVLARHDLGTLECRTYKGSKANIMRFEIDGRRFVLAFNHRTGEIELRPNDTGASVASFSNADSAQRVRQAFEGL